MPTLSEPVQRFIVAQLACFEGPAAIVAAVKSEFGVAASRQQVHRYSPAHGNPAPKWRALHDAIRTAFFLDASAIPIAQKNWRLRERMKLYRQVMSAQRPNIVLALEVLDGGAKETGGMFTNRREVTGADGTPLVPPPAKAHDLSRLSVEELVEFERLTSLTALVTDDRPHSPSTNSP
jgi:hypothetical protein